MSKKTGALSDEDRRFIIDNHKKMSFEEIAEQLQRTPELIKRHVMQKGLYIEKTTEEIEQENRLKMILYNLPQWKSVVASYDDDEIELYEAHWIPIIRQLHEDVLPTEHLFIHDWITLMIEQHRLLSKKKETIKNIRELKAIITQLELGGNAEDLIMANAHRANLSIMESAESVHANILEKLQKDIKNISSKIKADRETRRKIENSADTYWGYIALLDDEKYRGDESYKAELDRIAQEKSKQGLMELTPYVDGTVDYPLLNAETMDMLDQPEQGE